MMQLFVKHINKNTSLVIEIYNRTSAINVIIITVKSSCENGKNYNTK